MRAHVKVVGIIGLVAGALCTALGVIVPVGVLLLSPWFYGAPLWGPRDAAAIVAVVALISVVCFVLGIPALIAGAGLRKHRSWARTLAIIVAVVFLPVFPIGTGAGLYALWVLTKEEAKLTFTATA